MPVKPLTAVVHLPPSLSYAAFPGMKQALAWVLADIEALARGGFTSVLLENDCDKPHTILVNKAQVAWLTRVCAEVRQGFTGTVGVGVQRMDWEATLAVAAAAELDFVRLDAYVDTVEMDGQVVSPKPAEIRSYAQSIRGEGIALWTDVHVKHAKLLSSLSLDESVKQAEQEGAAAVLITSHQTGTPPATDDLQIAKKSAKRALITIGSGLTPEYASSLAAHADAAVVGTCLKTGDRIDAGKAARMVAAWTEACEAIR